MNDVLKQIGLSKKECDIYCALLKMGPQPASVLARLLQLPRSTVRYNCDNLESRFFIKKNKRGVTYYYSAERPTSIKKSLEIQVIQNQKDLEEVKHQLDILGFLISQKY